MCHVQPICNDNICVSTFTTILLALLLECTKDEHCTMDADKSYCDLLLNTCVGKLFQSLAQTWSASCVSKKEGLETFKL